MCSLNLTISVDDDLLRKAREHAQRRGLSLQEMLRNYLKSVVGETSPEAVAAELLDLMRRAPGNSGGRRIRRDDAYEGRA
jgi:Family of unknown function (DUF6364)